VGRQQKLVLSVIAKKTCGSSVDFVNSSERGERVVKGTLNPDT
jgi:hypothetical protein